MKALQCAMGQPRVNSKSKLITVRLPHDVQDALRELGEEQGRPWQTIMKELLAESLGLQGGGGPEITVYAAPHLFKAIRRIRKVADP